MAATSSAALLSAATGHLGSLLADLYVAMPSLASCGFVASMAGKYSKASSRGLTRASFEMKSGGDAAFTAMASIPKKLGLDMEALAALVTDAKSTLNQISR